MLLRVLRRETIVSIDTYLLGNQVFTISLEGITVVIRFLVYTKAKKRSDQWQAYCLIEGFRLKAAALGVSLF